MSTQSTAAKPSLTGVKIKARKGAVKAHAKHEPTVFRDQLLKYLETVPEGDFDGYYNKLVQAGSTLEFLKYADTLFELLLVGGLLQPGGSFVQDGAPASPFCIFNAKEPVEIPDMKKYVEVLNKLIRRYKYLQKPLEESVLPTLVQYINRWSPEQRDKFATAVGLMMSQGLASTTALQNLSKDHLIKNDIAFNYATTLIRAYLADQSMEQLGAALKRGGVKDLLVFLPPNRRDPHLLEEHFKKAGLPQVAEWFMKKQYAAIKDGVMKLVKELCADEDKTTDDILDALKSSKEEHPIPDIDFVACIWNGFMSTVDFSGRPDQIDGLVVREVTKYAPTLEPFCSSGKTQVALINVVQVYCYEDTRIIKAFPQILKVLYNKDCISAQAIIYWYQKGSKPNGRQHFLKATEALVKFLQAQEDSDEDEDDDEEDEDDKPTVAAKTE